VGGYGYDIRIKKRAPADVIHLAAMKIWRWFCFELEERVRDDFGKMLVEFVLEPPSVRYASGAIQLSVSDAGGLAFNLARAAVHTFTLLVDEMPYVVDYALAEHGLARTAKQPNDLEIRAQKFFWFDGSIGTVDVLPEGTFVSRDLSIDDENPASWKLEQLPAKLRKQAKAFIARRECDCPVCLQRRLSSTAAARGRRGPRARGQRVSPARSRRST